jgi:glycerophosphoryl diester phosphodiesterase
MKTLVWAHRGSSFTAPENTLEAFELAARQNADGIELDIHLTSDGQLAVIHDEVLERTTDGTGLVESCTMAQLKRLDAGTLHPKYTGARIPTLPEVLDFMQGNSLLLNIELKEERVPDPTLVRQLTKLIRDFKMEERTMFSSFNHHSLQGLRTQMPDACIGILYFGGLINSWAYAQSIGADCLHPFFRFGLMDGLVENAHTAGVKVNVWTVDEPEDMRLAYEQGVDGIITNKPDAALKLR